MRQLRKQSLAVIVWLTAAMTLVAGTPHLVCLCPGSRPHPPRPAFAASCSCEFCGSRAAAGGPTRKAGKACCCCRQAKQQPRHDTKSGSQIHASRCLRALALAEDFAAARGDGDQRVELVPVSFSPRLLVPLSLSAGIAGQTPWGSNLDPPPADLVIALQHLII
jgi:hypothetical protein